MGKHTTLRAADNPIPRQSRGSDAPIPGGYTSPLPIPTETQAVLELLEGHQQLQSTRILGDAGVLTEDEQRDGLTDASSKIGRGIAMLTGGALLAVGLAVATPVASSAQAATTTPVAQTVVATPASTPTASPKGKTWTTPTPVKPGTVKVMMHDVEPDPVAGPTGVYSPVVPVTIAAQTVRVRIPVTALTTRDGLHCGAVYGPSEAGRAWVGGGCSIFPSFPVTVTLDARYVPLGRSYMSVIDVNSPEAGYPQTVALQTKLAVRFGRGIWHDLKNGTYSADVPVQRYSPQAGTWAPLPGARVNIQEKIGGPVTGRWVVVATSLTHRDGIAHPVAVGATAGLHTVRATSPLGLTGTTRYVTSIDPKRYDYR